MEAAERGDRSVYFRQVATTNGLALLRPCTGVGISLKDCRRIVVASVSIALTTFGFSGQRSNYLSYKAVLWSRRIRFEPAYERGQGSVANTETRFHTVAPRYWCGLLDSNQRPLTWQASALDD